MDIPEDSLLPCGCLIRCKVIDGVNTLVVVSTCRIGCKNFQNLLDLAANKPGGPLPVTRREA